MSMGLPPIQPPLPPDLVSQEMSLRTLLRSLMDRYNQGLLSPSEYTLQHDHVTARLHDVTRAMHRQHQQQQQTALQQHMLAQQQMTAQAVMQQQSLLSPQYALQQLQGLTTTLMRGAGSEVQPALPSEDAFGELVAWRCWLMRAMPILTSCYRTDYIWMPREVEEAKHVGDHNHLGFHGWQDERQALGYALGLGPAVVVGRVKLWGTVIHHEKGYRAEFAKIESLDTLLTFQTVVDRKTLQTLRRHYGVDHKKRGRA